MDSILTTLNKILDERPATCSTYAVSTAFESRNSIIGRKLKYEKIFGLNDLEIPEWLEASQFIIGPYERSIIHELINSDDSFILIQGGTGSGKSTLLAFIHGCFKQTSGKAPWIKDIDPSLISPSNIGIPIVMLTPYQYRSNREDQLKNKDEFIEKFFSELSEQLATGLEKVIIDSNDVVLPDVVPLLFKEFIWPKSDQWEQGDRIQTFNTIATHLKKQISFHEKDWELKKNKRKRLKFYNKIVDSIEKLPSSRDKFLAWLFPYAALCTTLKKHKFPFIIAIDDVDQYEPEIQSMVYQHFVAELQQTRIERIGLKIVSFLRYSSSMNVIKASPQQPIVSHQSPIPSEVIMLKIASYLSETYSSTNTLKVYNQSTKQAILLSNELLGKLVHTNSLFYDALSSIAGSNIRLSFHIIKHWLLKIPHEKLMPENSDSFKSLDSFMVLQDFYRLISPYFIHTISDRINSGMAIISTNYNVSLSMSELSYNICSYIAESFQDSRLFNYEKKEAIRCKFAVGLGEYLEQSISNNSENKKIITSNMVSIGIGFRKLIINLKSSHVSNESIKELELKITNDLKDILASGLDMGDSKSKRRSLLEVFTESVIYALNFDKFKSYSMEKLYLAEKNQSYERRFRSYGQRLNENSINTNEAIRTLLNVDTDDGPAGINLFSANNNGFSPIALRIIYAIALSDDHQIKYSDISRILTNFDEPEEAPFFNTEDVHNVIKRLVNPNRRLIYSGIADSEDLIKVIGENPSRNICLTWAGLSYFSKLSIQPYYIGWCFESIFESHSNDVYETNHSINSDVISDLEHVVAIFRKECKYEIEIIQKENITENSLNLSIDKDKLIRALMPTCDIFYRSLFSYHLILRVNYRKTSRKYNPHNYNKSTDNSLQFSKFVSEWQSLSKELSVQIKSKFDCFPNLWGEEIEWVNKEFKNGKL